MRIQTGDDTITGMYNYIGTPEEPSTPLGAAQRSLEFTSPQDIEEYEKK